jgi:hypothetical protein
VGSFRRQEFSAQAARDRTQLLNGASKLAIPESKHFDALARQVTGASWITNAHHVSYYLHSFAVDIFIFTFIIGAQGWLVKGECNRWGVVFHTRMRGKKSIKGI